MDLYAQPIPPEMALQPNSRVNLKEALLQRLSQVQLQKQRETASKTDFDALEKGLLVEMLEKAQKMQANAQALWAKEKEDLLSQIRRLDAQSRRSSGDFRRDPVVASRRPQSDTLSPNKPEKDDKPKSTSGEKILKKQLSAAEKRVLELEKALELSEKRITELEISLEAFKKREFDLEKSLEMTEKAKNAAERELENGKFLLDERTAYIESLEESMKPKTVEEQGVQFSALEDDSLKRTISLLEEKIVDLTADISELTEKSSQLTQENDGFRDIIADQKEIISVLRGNNSANSGKVEGESEILVRIEEQSGKIKEIVKALEGLGRKIDAVKDKLSEVSSLSTSNDTDVSKSLLSGSILCIRALQDIISSLTAGKVETENGLIEALRAEVELLRKEKGMLTERLIDLSHRDISHIQAQLSPLLMYLASCVPHIEAIDAFKETESMLLNGVKNYVKGKGEHVCNHTEMIEVMSASLKTLQVDFAEYKHKVTQDKSKFSEQLFKIAESLEYRKDLWEQLQTLEADEHQLERLGSLSEELERQTEWESENLALLISWMRDEESEKAKQPRTSIATIPEEEEEEEDPTPGRDD